jgi:hypothetical protein
LPQRNTTTTPSKLQAADSIASEITPPMWRKVKRFKISHPRVHIITAPADSPQGFDDPAKCIKRQALEIRIRRCYGTLADPECNFSV